MQLIVSLGAAFLLLLAACATAANLLLSRALARQQEIATRTALGAGTRHIINQFGMEGLVAGLAAGLAGLAVAWGLIRILIAWAPAEIPGISEAGLDGGVLLFAGAVSLVTALGASVAPTWMATRLNVSALLNEGGTRLTFGRRRRRIQGAFTAAQAGTTVVLLTAALLIAVSFHAMLSTDIGFQNRDAVTMNLRALGARYNPERTDMFYTQLLDRLRELPAVTNVGAVLSRPLEGPIGWDVAYRTPIDSTALDHELPRANFLTVTPGYFQAIGTPLLEGRDFTAHDRADSEQVAVVSRSLAERIRATGSEPVGSRIGLSLGGLERTIVGVVADARYRGVKLSTKDVYAPYLQTDVPIRYPVITGNGSPVELADLVRREAQKLDPGLAVADVATVAQLVERDTALQRFNMTLLLVFAAGAIVLAGAGVYAVVTENVSERRREITIRMALGSDRYRIVRRLVASTLGFVIVGEVLGWLVVLAAGPSVSDLLYAVAPGDGVVATSVLSFLLLVSLLSSAIPAWAATGREPHSVLHND